MKVLSLSEFADFCYEKKPSCYIYATQNQLNAPQDYLRMVLRFPTVIINLKPDRICFVNEHDKLSVESVKCVQVYEDRPCVGTIFKIHSGGKDGESVTTWLMDM